MDLYLLKSCQITPGTNEKHTRVFKVVSVIVGEGLHVAIVVHFTEAKLLSGSQ